MLTLAIAEVSTAQLWNGLERPDSRWFVGSSPSQVAQFGISFLDFNASVTTGMVDSLSDFKFGWADQSFLYRNFLFVANGCTVLESFQNELLTLDDSGNSDFYLEFCESRNQPLGQQAFLPLNHDKVLFTKENYFFGESPFSIYASNRSVYTLDLSGNEPIEESHVEIMVLDTTLDQLMDFTSDGLGGWWGVARSAVSDRFQVFHFTDDSSYIHSVQHIGPAGFSRERVTTRMRFNPQGTEFVLMGGDDGVAFYYFDRWTGQISLREVIPNPDPEFVPYRVTCDVNWSAEGRFVYITDRHNIYQIDAFSSDLAASAVRITEDNPETDNIPYYRITRGPDCRIYVAIPGSAMHLSVIDKPSLKGRACNLKPAGVNTASAYFVGIPEFPNYALWANDRIDRGLAPIIDTAVCDSSILAYPYVIWTATSTAEVPEAEWTIYPNPARGGGIINVVFPTALIKQEQIYATLYNSTGQAVADLELDGGRESQQVMLPVLPKGVYTLALGRLGESLGVQQVLIQ
jgi:hypothetical protein